MKIKKIKLTIKDVTWTAQLVPSNIYDLTYGPDSNGITELHTKTISFNVKVFSESLVRHELFHAYVSSCCVGSMTSMQHADMEELCAEIFEFHGAEILKKSKHLFKILNKYKNEVKS